MMLEGISNDGAMPVLEAMVRFAGARQRLIAHNVANIDTPEFQPLDVSPREFQKALAAAVERRRSGGRVGDLQIEGGGDAPFEQTPDGQILLNPEPEPGNLLFHDRNNRDVERLMQANAENVTVFRVASDLLRSRTELMRSAIAERA